MSSHLRFLLVALTLAALTPATPADGDLRDLLRRLPATANTVAVIDVKAIRERTGNRDVAVVADAIYPPTVDRIVFATHLEPGELAARKTVGLVQLNRPTTLKEMAAQTNGSILNVGNMVVVDGGRRGYAVPFAPDLIGFVRRMNHQDLYRWKQFADASKKVALPHYLAEKLTAVPDAPIVAAMDLEHMIELRAACDRVARAKVAEGFARNRIEGCSALLVSLKGICLTVDGPELDQAEVRLDFGEEVGKEGDLVKAMFLEALDDLEATIPDFRHAKVTVESRVVKLAVRLSGDSLVRMMSLFAPPTAAPTPSPTAPKLQPNGVSLESTRKYFRAVDRLLEDLGRQTKHATNYLRSATWHETYADRIEELNTRYVDGDVVKYSQNVMVRMRTVAWSLRGVVVEVHALEKGFVDLIHAVGTTPRLFNQGPGQVPPWWLGGSAGGANLQVDTNIPQLRSQQAEIIRKDAERRIKIWESVEQDRRGIIKQMQERYGLDLKTGQVSSPK